jgi:putative transposase
LIVCKAGIQKIGDRDARRGLVSPEHDLSLSKQCTILGLNRTSIYYTPKGESKENLEMMQKIDAEHLDHPAKGVVV